MNLSLIVIRKRLPLLVSAVLVALGVALVTSALRAQPQADTARTRTKPNCFVDNWPPQDATEKQELVDAFNKALKDAAEPGADDQPGPKLRKALLDPADNYKAPKKAMKDKLKEINSNTKLKFPEDLVIIFYEEETEKRTRSSTPAEQIKTAKTAREHPNHCYIVVYMEPITSPTARTPNFQTQMMCCYDPY
ncbi:MAG TPA: hypothetical protein VM940_14795 [Chthoniobacterales bacterium]|jgi:hypothetical protein|nr:hypothetical protein [Chthoniobacterales bacterium]